MLKITDYNSYIHTYIYMQHYLMSRKDRLAMEQVKHKSKMDFFCQYTETSS